MELFIGAFAMVPGTGDMEIIILAWFLVDLINAHRLSSIYLVLHIVQRLVKFTWYIHYVFF
jgi:hypothetical protein